jgi:anti-sigma B factor antagonist
LSEFSIRKNEIEPGIVKFDVTGFLDAHTFERMQNAIDDCFSKDQYRLLVDLKGVTYISSAGAGVFIGAIGTAQEHEGNIVFMNPSENVKEVFDLLGLSLIFTFVETQEDALSALT